MTGNTLKILLSLVVLGGATTYLLSDTLFAGGSDRFTYFVGAYVVIAEGSGMVGKRVRMGGHVEKGTILRNNTTLEYQFAVRPVPEMTKHPEANGKTVTVRYRGVVPDTFKDDAQVIVTGALENDGIFHAKELLAKCPSKYEASDEARGAL